MKRIIALVLLPALFLSCNKAKNSTEPSAEPKSAAQGGIPPIATPLPPFQTLEGKRQDPELKVSTLTYSGKPDYEQPSFVVGNKRVGVREASGGSPNPEMEQFVGLMVDNHGIFRFMFWGGNKYAGSGFPFDDKKGKPSEVKVDKTAGTITYTKGYFLPDGNQAQFSYQLKSLGDSKVELSWDMGISQEKLDSLPADFDGVNLWMAGANHYRSEPLRINGQILALTPKEGLTVEPKPLGEGKGLKVEFAPAKALQSFSFELPDSYSYAISESKPSWAEHGESDLMIRTSAAHRQSSGKLVIDLGVGALKNTSAPAPVAGIDFWGRDAMDVAQPSVRNLMPNPSFEQGLRYWTWWWGGNVEFVKRDLPKYSVTDGGKFGQKALLLRAGPATVMQSFPIPVVKDKDYTVSFYAKAPKADTSLNFGIMSPIRGTKMEWQAALGRVHSIGTEWKRYSFNFKPDLSAVQLMVNCDQEVMIDGIQIEEGVQPTDFDSAEVEGLLTTSDPDNMIAAGQDMNASFQVSGKPGTKGEVELTVYNYFREKLAQDTYSFELDAKGTANIPLPYDAKKMGLGVFVLQAKYKIGGNTQLRDYYRFSIMEFLENKHATKNLFCNLAGFFILSRGDDIARNLMRWGWGSTTYNCQTESAWKLQEAYRIDNLMVIVSDSGPEPTAFVNEVQTWTEITPEREKQIEEMCFKTASAHPWSRNWAFQTETEGKAVLIQQGKYDEWAKVLIAFAHGIKRANPENKVFFDGGTSGFNRLRGYRETEGHLASTQGKVKWDSLDTHPYGDLDGTLSSPNDLDVEIARLIDLGKKYGYGDETPVDLTEGFNIIDFLVPEWGVGPASDAHDNFGGPRPTYDSGWKEFVQAGWVARGYLIALKYWPRLRSFNIWDSRPFFDMNLAPLAECKAVNTLGHLFSNPKFKADFRPAAGVRGYIFEDEQGRGLAAVWCNINKVDEGVERGPEMNVDFGPDVPECIDLMGNPRFLDAKDGKVSVQLSPAPLFFRTTKGGVDKLIAALTASEISGAGSSLKVTVQPTTEGGLELSAHNLTNKTLDGNITVATNKIPFQLAAQGAISKLLGENFGMAPGKIYSWKQVLDVQFKDGKSDSLNWDLSWFFVPHTGKSLPEDPSSQEWNRIPAIAMNNVFINQIMGEAAVKAGYPGDLQAQFQLAWDKDNLYLRVSVKDDHFVLSDPARWDDGRLYMHDGCAEVYFDTGANARSNSFKGFDLDDYRYDFSTNKQGANGAAAIYRLREPEHQLALGVDMPSKEEAASHVKAQFRKTPDGYAYVMIFPQRYIEPLHLEKGWRAGFGLFLHDIDDPKVEWPRKGISLATEPGAHCDNRPDLWPVMVLGD